MELDRQSIEKRDFPIGRRGYDPAAVDAHLRALAADVQELQRELEDRGGESLGSSAGTQVQGILEAAEAAAANIEREAAEDARQTRADAARDAEQTRADAVARAQAHVQAVSQATAVLLQRVESMDGETSALVQSLRDGAGRLAADLGAVAQNMGELYDAAAGGHGGDGGPAVADTAAPATPTAAPASAAAVEPPTHIPPPAAPAVPAPAAPAPAPAVAPAQESAVIVPTTGGVTAGASAGGRGGASGDSDLDGARLVALNMALNGEPREEADRFLAENYELADRAKLLDEVYAAIEG